MFGTNSMKSFKEDNQVINLSVKLDKKAVFRR